MHPNWKRRSKIISAYDMIFYAEKPKDYTHTHTHTLRELINELSKQKDKKSIYKNWLHFNTLIINNLKRKLQKLFHLQQHQKNKTLRN